MDTVNDDDMARVPATKVPYDHVDMETLQAAARATHPQRRIIRLELRGYGQAGCSIRNITNFVGKDGKTFFCCTDMSGRRKFHGYSTPNEVCIFSQV